MAKVERTNIEVKPARPAVYAPGVTLRMTEAEAVIIGEVLDTHIPLVRREVRHLAAGVWRALQAALQAQNVVLPGGVRGSVDRNQVTDAAADGVGLAFQKALDRNLATATQAAPKEPATQAAPKKPAPMYARLDMAAALRNGDLDRAAQILRGIQQHADARPLHPKACD